MLLFHRLALWLDAWLFRQQLSASLDRPVFIVGLPRSGTTYLQRLLSTQSHCLTTFPLWEAVFAPALCEKLLLAWLYRRFKRPADFLLSLIESRLAASTEKIHSVGLFEAEEDFVALLAYDLCFLRVFLFPYDDRSWSLARCDTLTEHQLDKFLRVYEGLLVRHQVFRHKRVLSKNPSLTLWSEKLRARFPQATVIAMRRNPVEVVGSQLSSIEPALSWFGSRLREEPALIERFVSMLEAYSGHLDVLESRSRGLRPVSKGSSVLDYEDLVQDPAKVVDSLVADLGIERDEARRTELAGLIARGKKYSSRHNYALENYGLDPQDISRRFAATHATGDAIDEYAA